MKVSHIVPTDLLDLIEGRDFYMCLANVAYKNKEYADFYKKQKENGAFILLDNGAAEANQMSLEIISQVIEYIHPNEVILNDSLCNKEETLIKSKQALDYYKSKNYDCQYMFVPQGKNFREWVECYQSFKMDDISTIGVSKFNTSFWKESDARYDCCLWLDKFSKHQNKQVHLLGCHENMKEVKYISQDFDFVRSNDTALAYIYAQNLLDINCGDRPKGNIDFNKSNFNINQIRQLEKNIKTFDNLFV